MENTLYLIWRHLQFYLVHCKPSDFAEGLIFKGIQSGGMRRLGGEGLGRGVVGGSNIGELCHNSCTVHAVLHLIW